MEPCGSAQSTVYVAHNRRNSGKIQRRSRFAHAAPLNSDHQPYHLLSPSFSSCTSCWVQIRQLLFRFRNGAGIRPSAIIRFNVFLLMPRTIATGSPIDMGSFVQSHIGFCSYVIVISRTISSSTSQFFTPNRDKSEVWAGSRESRHGGGLERQLYWLPPPRRLWRKLYGAPLSGRDATCDVELTDAQNTLIAGPGFRTFYKTLRSYELGET